MKTDYSLALMAACHYPGGSKPAMGQPVKSKMPKQKPKRSAKGGRSGSGSPPAYSADSDEG